MTIDEISSTPALREFASIYQILLRDNFHIALLMAGLPNKVSELQNDDFLTFLLRSQRIYLAPLDLMTIKESYQRAFSTDGHSIENQTLIKMVKATKGYAYGFQLLGYLVWQTNAKQINDQVLDGVLGKYQIELFRNVYTKIYLELSSVDRQFINAMAASSKEMVKISFIQSKMHKKKNYVSTYRRRLLDDQIIEAPAYGIVSFSLPFFRDFVNEYHDLYL